MDAIETTQTAASETQTNLLPDHARALLKVGRPQGATRRDRTVGQRMAVAREAKGLTQEGLGKLMGVTRGTVAAWETGSEPSLKRIKSVAAVLEVRAGWIAFGE